MLRFLALFTYLCLASTEASILKEAPKPVPIRDIGARIINGVDADDGQFPWQVAIFGSSPMYPRYLCGGALISREWVITAGHCVDGARSATIYSGSARMDSSNRTISQASQFILHENFDPSYLTNDIGLIKLREPLVLNGNIRPISLAERELEPQTRVTLSGWGQISDDDRNPYNEILNYISVSTIGNNQCQAIYGYQVVSPGVVCTETGNPLKSPCNGDSGGPVVANADSDDPIHVAIFSFINGYGCEMPYPAGNTRTAYFRDWIYRKTGV